MVVIIDRGGSRAAATAKMERFVATHSFKINGIFSEQEEF